MTNKFLFDVARVQSNSIMTFIVTRDIGEYKNNNYSVNMEALERYGYNGLISLAGSYCNSEIKLGVGMSLSVDVNKRYAWDKEEVICNQKVNYYCSKGWIGSLVLYIKNQIKIYRAL